MPVSYSLREPPTRPITDPTLPPQPRFLLGCKTCNGLGPCFLSELHPCAGPYRAGGAGGRRHPGGPWSGGGAEQLQGLLAGPCTVILTNLMFSYSEYSCSMRHLKSTSNDINNFLGSRKTSYPYLWVGAKDRQGSRRQHHRSVVFFFRLGPAMG